MAVALINASDTLETGFRAKANAAFNAIPVSASPVVVSGVFTGVIRLVCFDSSFINLDLSSLYYTQTQISQILSTFSNSPYSGSWDENVVYGINNVVDWNGHLWRSGVADNTDEPGTTGNWTDILDSSGAVAPIEIPFTAVTGFTVSDWQTDLVPDTPNTYATLFGNNLRQPTVEVDTEVTDERQNIPFDFKYTKTAGLIQTVTLDWSISQTGIIIF